MFFVAWRLWTAGASILVDIVGANMAPAVMPEAAPKKSRRDSLSVTFEPPIVNHKPQSSKAN